MSHSKVIEQEMFTLFQNRAAQLQSGFELGKGEVWVVWASELGGGGNNQTLKYKERMKWQGVWWRGSRR
jgi:hypothetical protein